MKKTAKLKPKQEDEPSIPGGGPGKPNTGKKVKHPKRWTPWLLLALIAAAIAYYLILG